MLLIICVSDRLPGCQRARTPRPARDDQQPRTIAQQLRECAQSALGIPAASIRSPQTAGESIAGLRGAGHAFAGNALAGGLTFAAMFA